MQPLDREIRIVVADDHPVVLSGLHGIFGQSSEFRVVAHAGDGFACIEAIERFAPEIALVDIVMPALSGLQVLDAVRIRGLVTKVVLFGVALNLDDVAAAANAGAHGVVGKNCTPEQLLDCLRAVANGHECWPAQVGRDLGAARTRSVAPAASAALTGREWEVTSLVARGLSNKDIARRLNVSDGTIKIHLHNIYQKLGVTNRTALVVRAIPLGAFAY